LKKNDSAYFIESLSKSLRDENFCQDLLVKNIWLPDGLVKNIWQTAWREREED
jgi:hypothetical protein